jgi:uncharacterized protein (DUF1778 family)
MGSTTFNVPLALSTKRVFERALAIRGQTLTDFVLGATYDRAIPTIMDDTVLRLSERDSEAFALALLDRGR